MVKEKGVLLLSLPLKSAPFVYRYWFIKIWAAFCGLLFLI